MKLSLKIDLPEKLGTVKWGLPPRKLKVDEKIQKDALKTSKQPSSQS
jgi:hypothetical protein